MTPITATIRRRPWPLAEDARDEYMNFEKWMNEYSSKASLREDDDVIAWWDNADISQRTSLYGVLCDAIDAALARPQPRDLTEPHRR